MSNHDSDMIIVETFPDGLVARFLQDQLLDPMAVEEVGAQLASALESAEPANLVISMESATLVSSLMLGVLVSLRGRAQARGGQVALAAVPDRIRHLLEVTNLTQALPLFETPEQALASFG